MCGVGEGQAVCLGDGSITVLCVCACWGQSEEVGYAGVEYIVGVWEGRGVSGPRTTAVCTGVCYDINRSGQVCCETVPWRRNSVGTQVGTSDIWIAVHANVPGRAASVWVYVSPWCSRAPVCVVPTGAATADHVDASSGQQHGPHWMETCGSTALNPSSPQTSSHTQHQPLVVFCAAVASLPRPPNLPETPLASEGTWKRVPRGCPVQR